MGLSCFNSCIIYLISGAFPSQLGDYVGTDNSEYIPRHDWQFWTQAIRRSNLKHLLFGDYTTIPYEFREIPFQGAPKIKYTLDNQWFVIKGHRSRQRDNQRQNQALAIANAQFGLKIVSAKKESFSAQKEHGALEALQIGLQMMSISI